MHTAVGPAPRSCSRCWGESHGEANAAQPGTVFSGSKLCGAEKGCPWVVSSLSIVAFKRNSLGADTENFKGTQVQAREGWGEE